ncbi:LysM peptidoglycan-binding domain-containing protein [Bhargavaea ginsengi]|uniref:C40 family peptidase n=1 Tax=Bhargavaea ginsengi TaxID=426757 RepID=UPI00203E5393|nr:peptidoglycan endopeptidase [Bhargavaea ginsengi]MCM3089345.1 LysM peptidoglycan-binding domain-containing protein [Bhargavaea ginsengi]
MKKIAFSVLATSALAAVIAAPGEAEASQQYAVQSGDSLWKIASKHQISVAKLKEINNIRTDVIYPGQTLVLSSAKPSIKTPDVASVPSRTAVYTVKGGDSLGNIASIHKMTVRQLKELNGLTGDLILVGQKLKVSGTAAAPSTSKANPEKATAPSSPASTTGDYQVKSGDTLSLIAIRHGVSVDQVMKWNGLTSHLIYAGQKLKIAGSAAAASKSEPKVVQVSAPRPAIENSHTVVSGDTLSGIGAKYGVSVRNLMAWNNLSNYNLYVGQKLKVKGESSSVSNQIPASSPAPAQSDSSLISVAKSVVGTPYVWGGTTPSGFDCSGFIWYAFKTAGYDVARTNTDGYFSRSYYVDAPVPGDLVFFNNTYKKGISHMGIYLGNGQFIHASSSQGVVVSNINDSYWKPRFDSFKRFYNQ